MWLVEPSECFSTMSTVAHVLMSFYKNRCDYYCKILILPTDLSKYVGGENVLSCQVFSRLHTCITINYHSSYCLSVRCL